MMKVNTMFGLALLVFMVALAMVVGERMSVEAMAVLIGVLAGVGASVPTSVIVVIVALRHWAPEPQVTRQQMTPPPPPEPVTPHPPEIRYVMVPPQMNGYAPNGWPQQQPVRPNYSPFPSQPQMVETRQFTVIGGETALD